MTGYPVSLNGRTTKKESSLDIVQDRYGKPVLTPIWGTDVTESRCIDVVKPPMMTAAEGYTPRKETILKTSRPNEMDNNRFEQPMQHPVRGANMTLTDQVTIKERRERTTAAEVGWKQRDLTGPSRCQETEVEAEGAITGAILSIPYRCCDCGIRITTGQNSATDGDKCREPIPSQMCPVGAE